MPLEFSSTLADVILKASIQKAEHVTACDWLAGLGSTITEENWGAETSTKNDIVVLPWLLDVSLAKNVILWLPWATMSVVFQFLFDVLSRLVRLLSSSL